MTARGAAAAVVMLCALTGCGGSPTPAAQPGPACTVQDDKADRRCTPGALNPDVTQATIGRTICVSGWTGTIRPPVAYTTGLKRRQLRDYGQTGPLSGYEEDHLVPLELGGAPRDSRNLWPEPRTGPHPAGEKDRAENAGRAAVCIGRIPLAAAQRAILTGWTR